MKLIRGLKNCPNFNASVVTIGNFDGVHLAHQKLIITLKAHSKEHNAQSIVLSFYPHPSYYFGSDIALLQGLRQKYSLLKSYGVDALVLIHFNEVFAGLTPLEFIQDVLQQKLSAKSIVIGDDFKFGKFAMGNVKVLNEHIPTTVIDATMLELEDNEMRVSSSNIRHALSSGDITRANALLGYEYSLEGRVVKGLGLGRTIGVPTANINIKNRMLAVSGVFIVRVELENAVHYGVVNIGKRPTIGNNLKTSVEVHLFDFDASIYGKILKITLLEKIRNEQKFASLDDLVIQIKKDLTFAKTKV